MLDKDDFMQIIKALISGLFFLLIFLVIKLSLVLSIILTLGVYFSLYMIFGSKKKELNIDLNGVSDDEVKIVLKEGYEKVYLIDQYAGKVKNPKVKSKIKEIHVVVLKIFDDFKEDPSDIKVARQFLNYQLDAVIKILDKYNYIAGKSVDSKEINETLLKTEMLLETIRASFEKQLALLLKNDLIDLETELKVLETNIKMEGLGV